MLRALTVVGLLVSSAFGQPSIDLEAECLASVSVYVDDIKKKDDIGVDYEASATEESVRAWSGVADATHLEGEDVLQSQAYSFVTATVEVGDDEGEPIYSEVSDSSCNYSEVPVIDGKTTRGESSASYRAVAGQNVVGESDEGVTTVLEGTMRITCDVTVLMDGVWHMSPVYVCEFAGGQYMAAQWNGLCWIVHSYVVLTLEDALDGNKRTYDIDWVTTEDLDESVPIFYKFDDGEVMPVYARVNDEGWIDKKLHSESHGPATTPQTQSVHVRLRGTARTNLNALWGFDP